ncbi:MAG: hypothetical protein HGA47_10675 [Zoogloea sp.]|nr:hypothetical protein [Zoogloea sp.]
MNLIRLVILLTVLASAGTASAAIDEDNASEFSYCAAIASTAKLAAGKLAGQQYFGILYTKYLWASIASSSPQRAKALFPVSIDRHEALFREGKSSEELTTVLVSTLRACAARYDANLKAIDAYTLPRADADLQSAVQPGVTTPLDLMCLKGKPVYEEYNQEGRFIYNFPTSTGFDLYHFDHEERLVKVQSYCDTSKASCGK